MPCKTSICKIQGFNYIRPKRGDKGTGKRGMVEGTNAASCRGEGTLPACGFMPDHWGELALRAKALLSVSAKDFSSLSKRMKGKEFFL